MGIHQSVLHHSHLSNEVLYVLYMGFLFLNFFNDPIQPLILPFQCSKSETPGSKLIDVGYETLVTCINDCHIQWPVEDVILVQIINVSSINLMSKRGFGHRLCFENSSVYWAMSSSCVQNHWVIIDQAIVYERQILLLPMCIKVVECGMGGGSMMQEPRRPRCIATNVPHKQRRIPQQSCIFQKWVGNCSCNDLSSC